MCFHKRQGDAWNSFSWYLRAIKCEAMRLKKPLEAPPFGMAMAHPLPLSFVQVHVIAIACASCEVRARLQVCSQGSKSKSRDLFLAQEDLKESSNQPRSLDFMAPW